MERQFENTFASAVEAINAIIEGRVKTHFEHPNDLFRVYIVNVDGQEIHLKVSRYEDSYGDTFINGIKIVKPITKEITTYEEDI